jgi:hypothetical protein
VFRLAAEGKTNAKGIPNLLQVAVLGQAFRQEFMAESPPPVVQRVVFAALAPLAWRLGYRATYPERDFESQRDQERPRE